MKETAKTSEADEQAMPSSARRQHADSKAGADNPKISEADASSLPSNTEKNPDDWTTGGETMTGAQASYLKTLCEEAGEQFDPSLNKADASKRIDALQVTTGRGRNH